MYLGRVANLLILIFIFFGPAAVYAQQTPSIAVLKDEIRQLERLALAADSTSALKTSSLRLLVTKRAQLRTSLQIQIESLRKYQASYGSRFSARESQSVNNLIQALESDLRNLAERNTAVSSGAHVRHVDRPATSPVSGGQLAQKNLRVASTRSAAGQTHQREFSGQPKRSDPCQGVASTDRIYLDWKGGSISPSRIKRPGTYCFVLINANTILYTYGFTLNVQEVEGNPLSALIAAIAELKKLDASKAGDAANLGECKLTKMLDHFKARAEELDSAVTALLPKKSGTKISSISLETTRAGWELVPGKFMAVETAAGELQRRLDAMTQADPCRPMFAAALQDYARIHAAYLALKARAEGPHEEKFSDHLDSTKGYDIVVKELYEGQPTEGGTKTYHITAAYSIISSSAGFMITQLPAHSYSSVTSPNPANPTTTQNVLSVDGSGKRVVLTALINYNLPFFGNSPVGLGLSAGPVFDISSGKADTSKFGFFAGPSLRLSEWVYVTPGAHVGEFADFPQGFTEGQVIPTGIGTPTPRKRYTTRFALGITFKVRDLVGSKGSSSSTPATQPNP